MKLPGIEGIGTSKELTNPTRRRFLGMLGSSAIPRPPLDIRRFGEILEGVGSMNNRFYSVLTELPVRFFEYEKWTGGEVGKLVGFPRNHQPIVMRRIKSELRGYLQDLEKLLGIDTELLRFFDPDNSYLQPEVSSYEANLEQGNIDGEFDFLDMILYFKIPGESENEEFFLEVNISPCENGVKESLNIGDAGVVLGRIDKTLGRITDEYEISLMDDNEVFDVLRRPMSELLSVFKRNSWHKNHEEVRNKQNNNLNIHKNLPVVYSEEMSFYDDVINGRIEITDKVRERVKEIFVK